MQEHKGCELEHRWVSERVGAGGRMVDRRTGEEEERAQAHREHCRWLQAEHAALNEHRSQHASLRIEEEYAVGNDLHFEAMGDDEEVRYRSLDVPSLVAQASTEVEVVDEDLVYRSLPSLARTMSDNSSSSSDASAEQTWLAAGRPPLLSRQRAFNRGHVPNDTPIWLGLEH